MAFAINTYLCILFNYCLTENLRPSHTTVKSVNLSTLFLDMLSPSERVHSFTCIWQLPYINRRQKENARWNNFKTNLPETYVAWLGLHVAGLPYRAQSLKQSELKHESFNRRVLWNAKTFTECDVFTIAIKQHVIVWSWIAEGKAPACSSNLIQCIDMWQDTSHPPNAGSFFFSSSFNARH